MAEGIIEKLNKNRIKKMAESNNWNKQEKFLNLVKEGKLDKNNSEILELCFKVIKNRYINSDYGLNSTKINMILAYDIVNLDQLLSNHDIEMAIAKNIISSINSSEHSKINNEILEKIIQNQAIKDLIIKSIDIQPIGQKEIFSCSSDNDIKRLKLYQELGFQPFQKEEDIERLLNQSDEFQNMLYDAGIINSNTISWMYQYKFKKLKEYTKVHDMEIDFKLNISNHLIPDKNDEMPNYWHNQSILLQRDAMSFVMTNIKDYVIGNQNEDIFYEQDNQVYLKRRKQQVSWKSEEKILQERLFRNDGMPTENLFIEDKNGLFMSNVKRGYYFYYNYNGKDVMQFLWNNIDKIKGPNRGFIKSWHDLGSVKSDSEELSEKKQEQFMHYVTGKDNRIDHQFFNEEGMRQEFFDYALFNGKGRLFLNCLGNLEKHYNKKELQYLKVVSKFPAFETRLNIKGKNLLDLYFDEEGLNDKFYHDMLYSDAGRSFLIELGDLEKHLDIKELQYMKFVTKFPEFEEFLISMNANNKEGINLYFNVSKSQQILESYEHILDEQLKNEFKKHIIENINQISIERIKILPELLNKISHSNSDEIIKLKLELTKKLLLARENDDPLLLFDKIENVYIKNSIPEVGKRYSCFETLHPDFRGFNFESPIMSPVLKNTSLKGKKVVIFSDLIKSSFGSNNKSVNDYLKNIEFGSNLYESIKSGQIQYDNLNEFQKKELITFSRHLSTLYNNTMQGKKEVETFKHTEDVMADILELSKKLSLDGTLDYNLGDRVIRMFCGFAGIDTLEEAKSYINQKIKKADTRNRNASSTEMTLEQGDFIKGIVDIKYLRNILQNGSVSKEYLGASADSDFTPLDTDVSMIIESDGTIQDKIRKTMAYGYGPIWLVLKNDDRFIITRTNNETLDVKRDMSKMEVFYTGSGFLDRDHYGIRTGFASSEINYIVTENYDPRVGLEIAMNGFYIPIANEDGKIIFTPNDYDKLRKKMNGLSYYGMGNYVLDSSIYIESKEISDILREMEDNKKETKYKGDLIKNRLKLGISDLGLGLKDKIDLSSGSTVLFNTGSTGRFTNLPGDGDFDYTMQVDRNIYFSEEKMNKLREQLIKQLSNGREIKYSIVAGDIRELQTTVVDEFGNEYPVEIDITFTTKTDKVEYASDVCVSDRLNSISSEEERNLVKANIIFGKKFLKEIGAYKPARKFPEQGGMGGIGVENWILQNGGTFYSAAKSFVEVASKCNSFEEFKSLYSIPNFGYNHMAYKKGFYPHDDYIENMNENGYNKMKEALNQYLNNLENEKNSSYQR